ncbi:MAG: methylated-DNA--[protein]-cysteine S-methyltransferase [Bacteroidales bacterium]|nr:methylated-DNA--[protein]-cysteine S-methyltransferase [Bacteroidales bacterium]
MKGKATITTARYQSPCGELVVGILEDKICLCDWECRPNHLQILQRVGRRLGAKVEEREERDRREERVLTEAFRQLTEYFQGNRKEFELPLLMAGSEFQKEVWRALVDLPYSATVSYTDIAERIRKPSAVRAVANAIGANPLSILIPCHRVIGKNGAMTGYAGGIDKKEFLLRVEK